MYLALACIMGLTGAMEVSREPVAIVVQYPGMQDISLSPDDVMIYSEDIARVESVSEASVTYSQRTMAEMVAANVPEPPPESKPTLPNEGRNKKRLDHTPPFEGTVTGDVTIIESGPNERIILLSNLQGDGIMEVLVKGGTAKTASGEPAKAVQNPPKVVVRNTRPAPTNLGIGRGASTKAAPALSDGQKSSLESHFDGNMPEDLKVVAEPVVVE